MAVRKPGKPEGSTGKAVARTGKSGRFVEVTPSRTAKTVAASALAVSAARMPRGTTMLKTGLVKVSSYEKPKRPVTANTTLKKAGGSLVMTLPASVRKALGLTEGAELSLAVEGTRVVMEAVAPTVTQAVRRPKYTLDELLAGSDPDAAMTDEERSWHDAAPVGREIW